MRAPLPCILLALAGLLAATAPAWADGILDPAFAPRTRDETATIGPDWTTCFPDQTCTSAVLLTDRYQVWGEAATSPLDGLDRLAHFSSTLQGFHRTIAADERAARRVLHGADALTDNGTCELGEVPVIAGTYTEFRMDDLRRTRPGGGYAIGMSGGQLSGTRVAGDLRGGVNVAYWLGAVGLHVPGVITWTPDPTADWVLTPSAARPAWTETRSEEPIPPWMFAAGAMVLTALLLVVHGAWKRRRRRS